MDKNIEILIYKMVIEEYKKIIKPILVQKELLEIHKELSEIVVGLNIRGAKNE